MKKTSSFEILLLAILISVIAFYAGFHYLIHPAREQIHSLRESISEEQNILRIREAQISSYPTQKEKLQNYKDALQPLQNVFFSRETEDTFLEHVSVRITNCQVDFSSLSAQKGAANPSVLLQNKNAVELLEELRKDPILENSSRLGEGKFSDYYKTLSDRGGRLETEIRTTSLSLDISGKYEDVLRYVHAVISDGKGVLCTDMTLELAENILLKAPENPEAHATMTLVFADLPRAADICSVSVPEDLPPYTMPAGILN